MQFWRITPAERAAKQHGNRHDDQVPVEMFIAALVGGGGAVMGLSEQLSTEQGLVRLALLSVVGICGMAIGGSIARVLRTRDPHLLLGALACGFVLVVVISFVGTNARTTDLTVASPPTLAPVAPVVSVASLPPALSTATIGADAASTAAADEPLLASAGPVPPATTSLLAPTGGGDAAATEVTTNTAAASGTVDAQVVSERSASAGGLSADDAGVVSGGVLEPHTRHDPREESDAAVSCTIDVRAAALAPTDDCEGRVTVEVFGAPSSGPSSWHLSEHVNLLVDAPVLDDAWVRVTGDAGSPPVCVTEVPEVNDLIAAVEASVALANSELPRVSDPGRPGGVTDADVASDPAAWMEQVRLVELRRAPAGTVVTLWSDCADPTAGTGTDPRAGWLITVG